MRGSRRRARERLKSVRTVTELCSCLEELDLTDKERELYGAEPPESGGGPQPLAASMAERIDDIAATVSELHAGSTGDSRRMIERRLRDLADAL